MQHDLDTSFRWPSVDERFVTISFATSTLFILFLQVLARQPTTDEALGLGAALRLAALPHDLSLTWSELMQKYGCDGTDPKAKVCQVLEGRKNREEQAALVRRYADEARRRGAKLVPIASSLGSLTRGGLNGIGSLSELLSARVEPTESKFKIECLVGGRLCPQKEPVQVTCARQRAPGAKVTGWVRVHVAAAPPYRSRVSVVASTVSPADVVDCILDRLNRELGDAPAQDLTFNFDAQ